MIQIFEHVDFILEGLHKRRLMGVVSVTSGSNSRRLHLLDSEYFSRSRVQCKVYFSIGAYSNYTTFDPLERGCESRDKSGVTHGLIQILMI